MENGRKGREQRGTRRRDLISTEAGLQAPSVATIVHGPEAALVLEEGGEPALAETVQDDDVLGLVGHYLPYRGRHLRSREVHVQDAVGAASVGGDRRWRRTSRAQKEVAGRPQSQEDIPGRPPGRPRYGGPVGDVVPRRRRAGGEGVVHGLSCLWGVVTGQGEDRYLVSLVQEHGGKHDVVHHATQACRLQPPVLEGVPVPGGYISQAPDGVGSEVSVNRRAVHGKEKGRVASQDQDAPGGGGAVAPSVASSREPSCHPPMVVGTEQRVEGTRENVTAGGRQLTKRAARGLGREQGEPYPRDREVVSPRDEPVADSYGVCVEGRATPRVG